MRLEEASKTPLSPVTDSQLAAAETVAAPAPAARAGGGAPGAGEVQADDGGGQAAGVGLRDGRQRRQDARLAGTFQPLLEGAAGEQQVRRRRLVARRVACAVPVSSLVS